MLSTNELMNDAAEQSAAQQKLSLEEVVALGEKLADFENQIENLQLTLKNLIEIKRELAEKTLPDALHNLGLSQFSLSDGTNIGLQEIISATINDENREAAHGWLREQGFGDIIKNEIVTTFVKGEDWKAVELKDYLNKQSYDAIQNEKVHPSTLKAFVRERLKNGEELPADTFKLFVGVAARVNKGKVK